MCGRWSAVNRVAFIRKRLILIYLLKFLFNLEHKRSLDFFCTTHRFWETKNKFDLLHRLIGPQLSRVYYKNSKNCGNLKIISILFKKMITETY